MKKELLKRLLRDASGSYELTGIKRLSNEEYEQYYFEVNEPLGIIDPDSWAKLESKQHSNVKIIK